ncbi:MAG: hypothetical protein ACU0CO_15890 [Shimia sp.]
MKRLMTAVALCALTAPAFAQDFNSELPRLQQLDSEATYTRDGDGFRIDYTENGFRRSMNITDEQSGGVFGDSAEGRLGDIRGNCGTEQALQQSDYGNDLDCDDSPDDGEDDNENAQG